MTLPQRLPISLRFALRELRGGLRGFRIFLACLALGVAAIAGVGSLSEAVLASVSGQGQLLLGGDIEASLEQQRASSAERQWLANRGRVSEVAELRAMARTATGAANQSTLVALKAVDRTYPLFGDLVLDPAAESRNVFLERNGRHGAAVDANLLTRLGLRRGDVIAIGAAQFEIRATIASEPDRISGDMQLGPRVLVSMAGLEASGLIVPGSLVTFRYRVALPDADARRLEAQRAEIMEAFPDAGFRIRDRTSPSPGLSRFVRQASLFFSLVALAALAVGGVGIANAVSAYLDGKRSVIATLKCLGATRQGILRIYLLQIMALAGVGIVLGLAAGALIPFVARAFLADILPIETAAGLYPKPLLLALAYGFLIALSFALWPISRACDISPASLFRDLIAPVRKVPDAITLAVITAALLGLVAIALFSSPYRAFAGWFVLAAILAFLLLRGASVLLLALLRRLPRPRATMARLAIANITRPGTPAPAIILSLGLGLTLLLCVALIDGNIRLQIAQELPARAPAFFFVDVQRADGEAFDALLKSIPGVSDLKRVPSLRGRILSVNGVNAADYAPKKSGWPLDSDRGVTYADDPPDRSTVIAGKWWPKDYRGAALFSLDSEFARSNGLKVGDQIRIRILGREIEGKLANLREVNYGEGGINYSIVMPSVVFANAPHTFLATIHATRAAEDNVQRAVTTRFPNVTVIAVREAIELANAMLAKLSLAIRAASLLTLLAGVLVLAGAIASGHRRRIYDAIVLKTVGATRSQILTAYVLEFALIGAITAGIAAVLAEIGAYLVITRVMEASFLMQPGRLVVTLLLALAATILIGLVGTERTLAARPAAVLRAP